MLVNTTSKWLYIVGLHTHACFKQLGSTPQRSGAQHEAALVAARSLTTCAALRSSESQGSRASPQACSFIILLASVLCRLLRTISDFRKRVERDQTDEATNIYLAELVRAVMGNIAGIKDRKHETLVAEILSVKLWNVPQVCALPVLWACLAWRGVASTLQEQQHASAWTHTLREARVPNARPRSHEGGAFRTEHAPSVPVPVPMAKPRRSKPSHAGATQALGHQLKLVLVCLQNVQAAVLDFVVHLVVANAAFIHACLQLLVYSLVPPPAPSAEAAAHGPWQPSEEVTRVQAGVVQALIKVSGLPHAIAAACGSTRPCIGVMQMTTCMHACSAVAAGCGTRLHACGAR